MKPFRVRPSRAALALFASLLACATAAGAQPITSFEPDTTVRRHGDVPPAGTVDLPVWFAADVSVVAPYVSAARQATYRTHAVTWTGASVNWPIQRWRRWLDLGYAHWDFREIEPAVPFDASTFVGQQPVIDEIVYRDGIDRFAGSVKRPWGFAGAGLGLGVGWISSNLRPQRHEPLSSVEADVRTGVLLQPNDRNRVTVYVSGGPVYELARPDLTGVFYRIELHVTWEQRIRVPKRLLPAP